jgi:hypothetical protein
MMDIAIRAAARPRRCRERSGSHHQYRHDGNIMYGPGTMSSSRQRRTIASSSSTRAKP